MSAGCSTACRAAPTILAAACLWEARHDPSRRPHPAPDARHVPALGHRGRPRDLGRVLRLELRLGQRRARSASSSRRSSSPRCTRPSSSASPSSRPRSRTPAARSPTARRAFGPIGGYHRRLRDAGRVRVRAAGDRAGDRRLSQRAVPGARAEGIARRRLPRLHGAQHRRRADRGQLRARRDAARDLRTAASSWASSRRASRRRNFAKGGWAGSDSFSAWRAVPASFAAIPFAIWFFLAIEGVAMAAEEAKDPKRSIPIAYVGGILTLVALAIGVMVFAGGVGRLDQARQHQRSAAAGDEADRRREQRLAAHAGLARAVRPRRLVPRDHHRLLAPDLRAGARRLPARSASAGSTRASTRRTSPSWPAA